MRGKLYGQRLTEAKGGRKTGSGVFQWKLVYMHFRLRCAYFILEVCQLLNWHTLS